MYALYPAKIERGSQNGWSNNQLRAFPLPMFYGLGHSTRPGSGSPAQPIKYWISKTQPLEVAGKLEAGNITSFYRYHFWSSAAKVPAVL